MKPENLEMKATLVMAFLRGFSLSLVNSNMKPGKPETEKYIDTGINSIIDGVLKFP